VDLRTGAIALGNVLAWTAARTWLAILLSGATVAAFGAYGSGHPLPDYGSGLAIIDQQMRRSHALPPAEVLVLGDSASFYGIDAVALEAALGTRVDSLAAIGPARPPGYAKLLENHLAHAGTPRVILLLLHPSGLMHEYKAHKRTEMEAVLRDAWPSTSFADAAVKALNFHLFRGLLEEPMEGEHGRVYGNGTELRRAIDAHRGSLVFPAPMPLSPSGELVRGGVRFEIHPDGRRDLVQMAERLRHVDPSRVWLGMTPVPQAMAGAPTEGSRAAVRAEVLRILGLPADHWIELPGTLPDVEFGDLTHALAPGRARLTAAVAEQVAPLLATPPSRADDDY